MRKKEWRNELLGVVVNRGHPFCLRETSPIEMTYGIKLMKVQMLLVSF